MVKKSIGGALGLVVLALVVIAVSVVRFDIPRAELARTYANASSQFLTLPDGTIAHVRDQGVKEGPVLVLVHGSNASLHTWEPWVSLLGDRFRIVTMDMPGHGLTGGVPDKDYSREGMVAFTHEVAQALGLTHYAIGGNSMGGGVAVKYAETYPDELTALVLVDASGLPRKAPPGEKIPLVFRLARMPILNRILLYVTPRSIVAEGLHKAFVDQSKVTDEMITRYYDLALGEGNREATGIRFRQEGPTEADADAVSSIKLPTLILWGERDGLIPVEYADAFARRIQGAKVVIYKDVGHIPMEEVAAASARDVRAFLESVVSAQAMGASRDSSPADAGGGAVNVPALTGKGAVEVSPSAPMDQPAP
ncbi:MAG: alpha/beta hydrolase [Parvibaculum sp.]